MDDVSDEAGASLSQSFGMDKADIFFGRTLKLTLGWKIRSHRSENGKKIMGEDPQSLENHGFPQISQLVLHSINPSESVDSDGFSLVFITFLGSLFLLFLFDPNRDPYGILSCSLETGHDSLAQSSLEAAGEQVSHGFCRLPLGCRGHVGVSVQGEPGAEVPQHPRHRFHIHPVLQGQGGKCVP